MVADPSDDRHRGPFSRRSIQRLLMAVFVVLLILLSGGFAVWRAGEGEYSYWESVYFTLITISTVGYSELPHFDEHAGGRVVAGLIILAGLGSLAFFQSTLTAVLVEGTIGKVFRRRRMHTRINKLYDHLIVAGAGRTGRIVIEELLTTRTPFVVIDKDEATLERLTEELGDFLFVVGDATEDHTLNAAGVERARGLIAALTSDPANLFVTLSARSLNPKARIASKVYEAENEQKMTKAGADVTISPHRIGGLRLVSEMVRPTVTEFLDQMLRVTGKDLRFEEVLVAENNEYAGRSLREIPIRQRTNLLVVALREPDGAFIYNPSADHRIGGGGYLIVIGELDEVSKLREMMGPSK